MAYPARAAAELRGANFRAVPDAAEAGDVGEGDVEHSPLAVALSGYELDLYAAGGDEFLHRLDGVYEVRLYLAAQPAEAAGGGEGGYAQRGGDGGGYEQRAADAAPPHGLRSRGGAQLAQDGLAQPPGVGRGVGVLRGRVEGAHELRNLNFHRPHPLS